MKTQLALALSMLLIAVGCDDSTHSAETAEIAKLQEQVENLQKIAAENAAAEKAALSKGNWRAVLA